MQWENEWGGEILFSHGSPRDPLGRVITLKIQIDGKAHVLVNIYVPNKDKDLIQFFQRITWPASNGRLRLRGKHYVRG